MLILHAKFRTKPERRKEMIELANGMLSPSNNEQGCISYEFFQNPFDHDSFIFVEKWKSRKDLDNHFELSHFKDFDSKVGDLIEEKPDVIAYEISDEDIIS
ncbi:MAG: hypothetical protein GTO02_04600 [Candidatus Dadabacteria bacterium]|nr:hypothetical protein [Candidatus Dadabacteria bacterium]NIQ13694.1 hypothetical protein [Candidatus Dadabacteria bacterium]